MYTSINNFKNFLEMAFKQEYDNNIEIGERNNIIRLNEKEIRNQELDNNNQPLEVESNEVDEVIIGGIEKQKLSDLLRLELSKDEEFDFENLIEIYNSEYYILNSQTNDIICGLSFFIPIYNYSGFTSKTIDAVGFYVDYFLQIISSYTSQNYNEVELFMEDMIAALINVTEKTDGEMTLENYSEILTLLNKSKKVIFKNFN